MQEALLKERINLAINVPFTTANDIFQMCEKHDYLNSCDEV